MTTDLMTCQYKEADTAFMAFWGAVNTELEAMKLDHLTFGPARELWMSTMATVRAEQVRAMFRKVAK